MTMPRPRKSNSEGRPTRDPIRAATMAAISTTALTSRMMSMSTSASTMRILPGLTQS